MPINWMVCLQSITDSALSEFNADNEGHEIGKQEDNGTM